MQQLNYLEALDSSEMDIYYFSKLGDEFRENTLFAMKYLNGTSATKDFNEYLYTHGVDKTTISSRQMLIIRLAFNLWKFTKSSYKDAEMDICVDSFHNCYDISVTV